MSDAVGGFASEVVFFLIGAIAIGTAVEVSGLAARAARFLGRMARGSPARLYVQMIASLPAFAVLVPSAITRNAILIPAYEEALDRMGIGKTDRSGRMLMLALGVLNPLASSALLTGGLASMTAASLLGGFSWLRWFALMAVPYYALLFGGALLLRCVVGPFEPAQRASTSPADAATVHGHRDQDARGSGRNLGTMADGPVSPPVAGDPGADRRRRAADAEDRRADVDDVRKPSCRGASS